MPHIILCAALGLFALVTGPIPPATYLHAHSGGQITIQDAWARPTVGRSDITAAYLTMINKGDTPDRLVSASSAQSDSVELHEHKMEGGMMRMRAVEFIPVPAHGSVTLGPGGYHLMVMGLSGPLKPGNTLTLRLHFEDAGDISAQANVQE